MTDKPAAPRPTPKPPASRASEGDLEEAEAIADFIEEHGERPAWARRRRQRG